MLQLVHFSFSASASALPFLWRMRSYTGSIFGSILDARSLFSFSTGFRETSSSSIFLSFSVIFPPYSSSRAE